MPRVLSILLGLGLAALVAAMPARAAELRLAFSSPPTSLDPHWHNLVPNLNVSQHIFETLVTMDADGKLQPTLAESWRLVDPTTWEFKLRPGVKFQDGGDFTAADVVYSLARPATLTNSPAPFTIYTNAIAATEAVDPLTVRIRTKTPYPLLLNDLSFIYIMSKHASEGVPTEDVGTGKGVIGTGPYKLVRYLRDDRVELARFDGYWGRPQPWDTVTLRFIPDGTARIAALLAGDIDALENVPTPDLPRVRQNPNLVLAARPSFRLIYFYVDGGRTTNGDATAKDGSPLPKNPLADLRVRQAINLAINRQAIRDRIMDGLSDPANNLVPVPLPGSDPARRPVFDLARAKALLVEAGYPDGFALTLHGPNNRFINDDKIVPAMAQMLQRIGIAAKVDLMPMAVYAGRGAKREFWFGMIGWGNQSGEASNILRALIVCEDRAAGWGTVNWSSYCNPKVDDLTRQALGTLDDAKRADLLRQAADIALDDVAIVPIHFQSSTWAMRKGIRAVPRGDERTFAQSFSPAP